MASSAAPRDCVYGSGLIQASDGNFYGNFYTTYIGGDPGPGSVFKLTAAGTLTALHAFDCNIEGCRPYGLLIQASDGNFYGTVSGGTAGRGGTVFKLTAAGALTQLHVFDCSTDEGCLPEPDPG